MAKTRTINGDKVTADRIAGAIIDRLILLEKKLSSLQKEVDRNFEIWAESAAHLTADDKLRFGRVGRHDSES